TRPRVRFVRVALREQGMFGRQGKLFQQPLAPAKPAVGDRGLSPVFGVVVTEPDGPPGSAEHVVAGAVEAIATLPGFDPAGVLLQPPARHGQTFERLGRVALGAGSLEAAPGLLPVAFGESG